MLSVHGNNNGVPDLRYENLWLIFDLHVCGCKNLRVYTLRQARKNISPRGPDRYTEVEGPSNGENAIPDDVPKIRIEEEQTDICNEH